MSKLPLVEGVLDYIKENNTLFCMPGHKGGKGLLRSEYGRDLYYNIVKADITEVDGVDNLYNCEGIIKESQELLSSFYGSFKSYFLVNGSSSGNLTMIFSSFEEGDKVIVERNCHKSIYNGMILRKLEPIFVKNKINNKYDAPLSIDEEHFLRVIKSNPDAKGIVVTYPNYYGICPNLELIVKEAKERNMKVLVDCAHGAHFGIIGELPQNPLKLGADMVVMSCHKTLPSFTQTAYLHINEGMDSEKVELYISMFLSTSPSYMLMCSMDYARFYLEEYGQQDYARLVELCQVYRKKINSIYGFYILDESDIENNCLDTTRYIINVKKGYDANKVCKYLREKNIQAEMNDGQNIVLIFSTFNGEEDFEKLYSVMKKIKIEEFKKNYCELLEYKIPQMILRPFEVVNKEYEYVDLEKSCGRVSASMIVPYPPGVPLIVMGEMIDKSVISMIKYYLNIGIEVMGITKSDENYKIKVAKKEERD